MRIKRAVLSQKGGRKKNEDYCSTRESGRYRCYVLADGLGGHTGGELASKYAVEGILRSFKKEPGMTSNHIHQYLQHARDYVKQNKGSDYKFFSLKTTLVILITDSRSAVWAHIGDSRLYYFNGGKIAFQTKDHSVPQLMAKAGEIKPGEIRTHEDRNRLTRVFDDETEAKPEIMEDILTIKKGDAFLLCTDGLWEYVYEEEMESELLQSSKPKAFLKRLENLLLKRVEPEHDNYSAIAVMVF